jgi:asparagine synthase (glutamine-hydrolysing)
MCGIFGSFDHRLKASFLEKEFMKIQHRGPDYSEFREIAPGIHFGFHRLAINGLTPSGNQPMHIENCWLVANAEIFNYQELAARYDLMLETGSDCEVIIRLYRKIGLEKMIQALDGEFAFLLYDELTEELFACRDHLGIRGMYFGTDRNKGIHIASEAKALVFCDELKQFPPGHYWTGSKREDFVQWYHHEYFRHDHTEKTICENIEHLLTEAVRKRLMSERPVGCLLSGGLDSSLIAALAAREYRKQGHQLETFSIGMPGSPDLKAAQLVADHIGSKHHHIELSEAEFISTLEETIYVTGSYDVTTIRASVGHILVAKYVNKLSDVKVLFTGETADEFGSYLYFQNAPSPEEFQDEALRLLSDIHYFDMKRGDRSISYSGLEARVPFADKALMSYYMGIEPALRMFSDNRMEKYLIRKAFEASNLLPAEVLWRRKNGFSDSVSQKSRSWSQIIKEYVETKVSDEEFKTEAPKFTLGTPLFKEAYYFRKVFHQHYAHHEKLTPYQWLPKWCGDVVDPSARVLQIYAAD